MIKFLRHWMSKICASWKEPGERNGVLMQNAEQATIPPSEHWRQGDILPDALAQEVLNAIQCDRHCHPHRNLQQPGVLVLVSQDCDLTNEAWDKEPLVEGIWGYPLDRIKKNLEQNSPRAVALGLCHNGNNTEFIFEDRNRFSFPRLWLQGHGSFSDKLPLDARKRLIRLLTRRYDRQPLPTAFNNRLRTAKVDKKIEELLDKNQAGLKNVSIYVALDCWDEPPVDDPGRVYKAFPMAVVRLFDRDNPDQQVWNDPIVRRQVRVVMRGLKDTMQEEGTEFPRKPKDCSDARWLGIWGLLERARTHGIELMDPAAFGEPICNLPNMVSERDFTLDDLNAFRAWEYDYLSPDDGDATPIGPNDLP